MTYQDDSTLSWSLFGAASNARSGRFARVVSCLLERLANSIKTIGDERESSTLRMALEKAEADKKSV